MSTKEDARKHPIDRPEPVEFCFDGTNWRLKSDPSVLWSDYFAKHSIRGGLFTIQVPSDLPPPQWSVAHVEEVLSRKRQEQSDDSDKSETGSFRQGFGTGAAWAFGTALMYLGFIDVPRAPASVPRQKPGQQFDERKGVEQVPCPLRGQPGHTGGCTVTKAVRDHFLRSGSLG